MQKQNKKTSILEENRLYIEAEKLTIIHKDILKKLDILIDWLNSDNLEDEKEDLLK